MFLKITDNCYINKNEVLGKGGFSKVYEGTYNTEKCAIKELKKREGIEINILYEKEISISYKM